MLWVDGVSTLKMYKPHPICDAAALNAQIDLSAKPDGKHAKIEKYILRQAFDTPEEPYLPDSVLYRQKEAFSDGVGYSWVDGLKAYAQSVPSTHLLPLESECLFACRYMHAALMQHHVGSSWGRFHLVPILAREACWGGEGWQRHPSPIITASFLDNADLWHQGRAYDSSFFCV